jgi:hypothetical protein
LWQSKGNKAAGNGKLRAGLAGVGATTLLIAIKTEVTLARTRMLLANELSNPFSLTTPESLSTSRLGGLHDRYRWSQAARKSHQAAFDDSSNSAQQTRDKGSVLLANFSCCGDFHASGIQSLNAFRSSFFPCGHRIC